MEGKVILSLLIQFIDCSTGPASFDILEVSENQN
jgi:hypothetical protein